MSDDNFGKIYHTKDGRTIFVDPKTNQASVFDGVLTLDKIMEPGTGVSSTVNPSSPSAEEVEEFLKTLISPNIFSMDFMLVAANQLDDSNEEDIDILGPKDYYILLSSQLLLSAVSPKSVRHWVSEYKNGYRPSYEGFTKHKILPEQWDWLNAHKLCPVVAWYDKNCPVFPTIACQDHAKVIQPYSHMDTTMGSSNAGVSIEMKSIDVHLESVLAEERDV